MDHLPLHRQLQRFARVGLEVPQSTLNGWVKNSLDLFVGLHELNKKDILATGYLNVDETGMRVLDTDKKGTTWILRSKFTSISLQSLPLI